MLIATLALVGLIAAWFGFGWLAVGAARAHFAAQYGILGDVPPRLERLLFMGGPIGFVVAAEMTDRYAGRAFRFGFRWRVHGVR